MTGFLFCFAAALFLAYHRAPGWQWILTFAVLLSGLTYFSVWSTPFAVIIITLFVLMLALMTVRPIRQKLISRPLFSLFRARLPVMSATEKEALEAGTTGWESELFSGIPDWDRLHSLPEPRLTAEEQAFLDGPVEQLCAMLDDWEITHEEKDLPGPVWDFIKQQRFFGMIIPRDFDGLDFSAQAHSEVIMRLASRSITAAVTVMVPNSLGPGMLLMKYGTASQKDTYLPRLAKGEEIPCFALTSPQAGSDAGAMTDHGIVCRGEYEGRPNTLGIRLNWDKRYITLCPVATLLGLAFKLYDPDHLLGEEDSPGITLALIPTSHPGVITGRRHRPANLVFQNGPTSGRDVFIPLEWVIGGREGVGRGWRMLMECLADGRGISLPSLSTAAGKAACLTTGAYARIRHQFNLPIGRFEGVQEALARMAGLTYIMNAGRNLTLVTIDEGGKPSVSTAIVKYSLTEAMRTVINNALDVHGGKALMLGPRNYLFNAYQAIPVGITVEGSNILTRNMIIFGQGAIRCHPYVLDEMEAATEMDEADGLRRFDRLLFGHAGFFISNLVRTLVLGLSNGRLHQPPAGGSARQCYRQVMRMSSAFALLTDTSLILLGGTLKRRERLSARLADILSNLYLACALLKQFRDQGGHEGDTALLEWSCQYCLYNVQETIHEFLANFPNRIVSLVLKRLIFPFGRVCSKPSDILGSAVADMLLNPGGARDRLTDGLCLPEEGEHALRLLELAFSSTIEAEPAMDKISKAMRGGQLKANNFMDAVEEALIGQHIDHREAEAVRQAMSLNERVIAVDDFNPNDISSRETL